MESLLEVAKKFFDEDNWRYQELKDQGILTVAFKGESGQWSCYAQAQDQRNLFVFYSISPTRPEPGKIAAMAEYLTRVNYNMALGNFEMDMEDGEIRFKTSIDVTGQELTVPLVRQMVYSNLISMDRYLPGIQAVANTDEAPAEVIARIEAEQ
jgi:hypothetical protein